jgi:adenylosuccinate synthase
MAGVKIPPKQLVISDQAPVILSVHKTLDAIREAQAGDNKIGTTGRGIGPAYEDRASRKGIRICDLLNRDVLHSRLVDLMKEKNWIMERYNQPLISIDQEVDRLLSAGKRLIPWIRDEYTALQEIKDAGGDSLYEGAQGTWLDVDYGSWPFVTSSNTLSGAAYVGSPSPKEVVGVVKGYSTRVGSGPFPTEETGPLGESLRGYGSEYGATTGRPRRCGWFDATLTKRAIQLNGVSKLALMKLDVLSNFDQIPLAVYYPVDFSNLESAEPKYEIMKGWKTDISHCKTYDALPHLCKSYIARIESLIGVSVGLISVGPDREQTLVRSDKWI